MVLVLSALSRRVLSEFVISAVECFTTKVAKKRLRTQKKPSVLLNEGWCRGIYCSTFSAPSSRFRASMTGWFSPLFEV